MKLSTFIKYLTISSLSSVVLFFLIDLFIVLRPHITLLWLSLVCFISLAVLIYFLIDRSMRYANGKSVIGLVILNVFIKLIVSFGFMAFYVNHYQPQQKTFIIPFLMTYLVFTIFETWFLHVQARGVK